MLKTLLGINGVMLWRFANGSDESRVCTLDYVFPAKSIGHGITCTRDLVNDFEVWQIITELTQGVSTRLRNHNVAAASIQISVRDCKLLWKEYQARLEYTTQSAKEISQAAYKLFKLRYAWDYPIRSITVRAINLIPADMPQQISLLEDVNKRDKAERLEQAVEGIRKRYGRHAVRVALVMHGLKMPGNVYEMTALPGFMYQ